MSFSKPLCEKCSLNGDCYCQKKNQKVVNECGMDEVFDQNEAIQRKHSQTYNNPDYADWMDEQYR